MSAAADDGRRDTADRTEVLAIDERWIDDAFRVMPAPGGFALRLVDMSRAKAVLGRLRDAGLQATFTHLVVRAAAIALARNPDLHRIVCGYRRLVPATVDIGLSMAGQTTYAPVVVIPRADCTPIGEMVGAVNDAVRAARDKERKDLENLRRQGGWVPWGWLRRLLLRWLQTKLWFRRRLVGTFQVSCLPSVDIVGSFLFYTGSILGAGSVQDRVVAVDGQPAVRSTMWLTVCIDHAAMDGRRAGKLLKAIKDVLEGDELAKEAERVLHPSTGFVDVSAPTGSEPRDGMTAAV